jgi:hypothetical protein
MIYLLKLYFIFYFTSFNIKKELIDYVNNIII